MRFGSLSLISRVGCGGRSRTDYLTVMSRAGYCFPSPRHRLLVAAHIKQCCSTANLPKRNFTEAALTRRTTTNTAGDCILR